MTSSKEENDIADSYNLGANSYIVKPLDFEALAEVARHAGYYWLAIIGVLNSAISLYYYVRVVVFMYIKTERAGSEPAMSPAIGFALAVAVAATLFLGIYPRLLFDAAEASARTLGAPIATALR